MIQPEYLNKKNMAKLGFKPMEHAAVGYEKYYNESNDTSIIINLIINSKYPFITISDKDITTHDFSGVCKSEQQFNEIIKDFI